MNMRTMAFAVALTLAQGAAWAGVTRTITPCSDGCEVKLEWSFSGKVESDLVIEERIPAGWSMKDSSVSTDSLDAWCCTNSIVRFAVNPNHVTNGSIVVTLESDSAQAGGRIAGNWQLYLDGTLTSGSVGGRLDLPVSASANAQQPVSTSGALPTVQAVEVWQAIPIKSFKFAADSSCELSYEAPKIGTLVVEGCEGLGKDWMTVKSVENVPAGAGTVTVEKDKTGNCRFYRMKLMTKENN